MLKHTLSTVTVALAAGLSPVAPAQDTPPIDPINLGFEMPEPREAGYETVNGLDIYYEVHGEGEPLLLIHGGLMTIEALGPIVPTLAQTRAVYAVELEGHGRTVDLDRPLSMRQMAEDVAGFITQQELGPVDIVGYSMGGGTALGVAILAPELVDSMVVISASHQADSIYESVRAGWPHMTAEMMEGTPMQEAYNAVAPEPERFPGLIDKIRETMLAGPAWSDEEIAAIDVPTLLIVGDNDIVQPDKVLEMYRLMGGATSTEPMGPVVDPDLQFAVLPKTTHYDMLFRLDVLMPVIGPFLDAHSGQ
ncbi:alpha/beta fold hydrolase [Pelagibacterium halotolerans]|uniref:alpha/beta fold hydrolase n=1 Tax=Pelagibacterium halotolerans TaxID=531813 RepID=UPI0038501876